MTNQSFWNNKRVLITGHTGFKGSWLALWLNLMGARIGGYALEPHTEHDNFVLTGLNQRIDSHRIADIRNYTKLFATFQQFKPEIVFHLAAQPIVRKSYINPKETYDINLGGTVNLLECCRLSESVRVIVNVTSDKCYENLELNRGYREDDRLGGYDPYSSSKAGAEIISAAYRQSFFKPMTITETHKALATVRAGNVIGGGDWQIDRLLPDCIMALKQQRPINIRNPHATRPWQNVLDPLSGYMLLAEKMYQEPERFNGPWNFGPHESSMITVAELVDTIINLWGNGSRKTPKSQNEPHETTLLKLDINKAVTVLGWTPRWNLESGLQKTIYWYKHFFADTTNMCDYAIKQIQDYQESIIDK